MTPNILLSLWDAAYDEGIWVAPWSKALDGLTVTQALWRPAPDRRCIWELVEHVCFWRDATLAVLAGGTGPSADDVARANFALPDDRTDAAWTASRARLRRTHDAIRAAIAAPGAAMDRLPYHLGHDCYHLGQIMLLRALQGLPPIE